MLKTRIITSIILLPLFLAALFLLPPLFWSLLMLAMVAIGAWEWGGMIKLKRVARQTFVAGTVVIGIAIILPISFEIALLQKQVVLFSILIAALFWALLVPIWLSIYRPINSNFINILIGWLILLATWLSLVIIPLKNPLVLVGIMLTVWIADSAAYFAGKRFGRRKLAPTISPGKTWEGVAGAFLAVSLYGLILCQMYHLDMILIPGLLVLTALSVIGDLFESLIKRQAGVKDSGRILPGHGGVLDRIDGLTATLPLAAVFVYLTDYYELWMRLT
jgi:phosphatidate cytidylyltransferase